MFKISHPSGETGRQLGVLVVDGTGYTDDEITAHRLRRRGYTVDQVDAAPAAYLELAGGTTPMSSRARRLADVNAHGATHTHTPDDAA